MKCLVLGLLVLCCFPPAKADDMSDATAAFATMVEYQKADDIRLPDLFAPDVEVKFTATDGSASRSRLIPSAEFHKIILDSLALKRGNRDEYEEVKFAQEGESVRVTSTVLFKDSGKREPFSLLYIRGKDGTLKIKQMSITVPVKALPPG